MDNNIPREKVNELYDKLIPAAARKGYFLNPDEADARGLVASLLGAKEKYGYMSCPCRLASGDIKKDGDIICPCVYRAPDIAEYGNCFCGLYVSLEVNEGKKKICSIPERRPKEKQKIF
ncbi:MAG: ferredoxin-thioredoxin reductase catalytic domain-containing protein [Patescibacteria group bacterium]|jgi:ferredoxin-thioredoxin reductase catalytic subunit